MESNETDSDCSSRKGFDEKPYKNEQNEESRRRALSNLIDDFSDLKSHRFLKEATECVVRHTPIDVTGLKRSASVAVLNMPGDEGSLDVEEHKFFVKLKSSSKEIRNIMWSMHERRQRKEAEEELMKCRKDRKAAVRSALEAVKAVQDELSKTTSLTVLRSRLNEAETNNKELKESIFHKMSDRSLVRLSAQPDLPRLVWQIVSLESQVTVLQERLRHISDKLQNISANHNDQDSSLSLKDVMSTSATTVTDKPRMVKSKSRTGWKIMMNRLFGTKKLKE